MQISSDVVACLRSPSNGPSGNTKLIEILSSVSQEEREYIMRCYIKPEQQTVFLKACVTQPLNVVEYLLQNCKPNVDDKCYFFNHENGDIEFDAFPLWYAARFCNVELVKLLIQYGADVNARTRKGESAIHTACLSDLSEHVEIVKILGAAGANVNSANNKGLTCLMASYTLEIVRYLLNKGVDVNARETTGDKKTALHYAIDSSDGDSLSKVKALVEAGADMTIPDKNGYQPFIFAAIAGETAIMTYLLEKNPVSAESKFKAHVLLAASQINHGDEKLVEGLQQLTVAFDLLPEGYEHPEVDERISHFFPAIRVPRTSSDAMQLLQIQDENALQAIIILLASQHIAIDSDFLISALHIYVECLGDENRTLSLSMCSFVYNLILNRKEWFHANVGECVCWYVDFLGRMCLERTPVSSDLQSEFDTLMNRLTNHIIMASKEETFIARQEFAANIFDNLMIALLYMVNIGIKCRLRDVNLKADLRRLASVNLQTVDGETLLHLLVDKYTLETKTPIHLHSLNPNLDLDVISCLVKLNPNLDLDVISCLVEQGFPLDTQDIGGKTPLSFVLLHVSSSLALEDLADECRRSEIIGRYLLDKGAHPDVQSQYGTKDVPVLEDYGIPPVKYLTLKCLAANAVVAHNIPYHDEMLPVEVKSFIELHAPYKQYQTDILHESLD